MTSAKNQPQEPDAVITSKNMVAMFDPKNSQLTFLSTCLPAIRFEDMAGCRAAARDLKQGCEVFKDTTLFETIRAFRRG